MIWYASGVITASTVKAKTFLDLRPEHPVTPACTLAPMKQRQSSVETLK